MLREKGRKRENAEKGNERKDYKKTGAGFRTLF